VLLFQTEHSFSQSLQLKGMVMAGKKGNNPTPIDNFKHQDKRRNLPTYELRDFAEEYEQKPQAILYPRDPPWIRNWSGKAKMSRTENL
jgi:hypothetical protein